MNHNIYTYTHWILSTGSCLLGMVRLGVTKTTVAGSERREGGAAFKGFSGTIDTGGSNMQIQGRIYNQVGKIKDLNSSCTQKDMVVTHVVTNFFFLFLFFFLHNLAYSSQPNGVLTRVRFLIRMATNEDKSKYIEFWKREMLFGQFV